MFKRLYIIVRKYFNIKANNKKILIELFITSLIARVSLLTLPFIASKIVGFISNKDYKTALIYSLVFGLFSFLATFLHRLNYNAYKRHYIYTHNKMQDIIVSKVTMFDEDFSKKISKSFIVNPGSNGASFTSLIFCLAFLISSTKSPAYVNSFSLLKKAFSILS